MKIARLAELSVEELANTITHGAGLVLSLIGFAVLLFLAAANGDAFYVAGSIIYGASLVTLYAASTLYHSSTHPQRKGTLQLLDHCCIYVLIAGTYTPFLLIVLRSGFAMVLLAVVWTIAAAGISIKLMYRGRFEALGIVLYLALGWLGIAAMQPLYVAIGLVPIVLILLGGVSYSASMIFYGWKSIRHHHAIFHVFVLAGSILHYAAIVAYAVPKI